MNNSSAFAPAAPVLSFANVSKSYGAGTAAVHALVDVSVDIAPGGFTAIMGPSGSGKSTMMNIAAGLDSPTSGETWIAGQPVHQMNDHQRTMLRRTHIGFIFQSFNLVPTLSAAENVRLPFALAGRRVDAQTKGWIDHLTQALSLSDRMNHLPGELSGGQQQRVAITRALASRPQIVFADEPTGNLDTRTSREVLTLLKTAATEYRQTIVMVTHDPVAASYADRILFIADGGLAGDYDAMAAQQISDMLIGLEAGAA